MFVEQNGILIIEAESVETLPNGWEDSASFSTSTRIEDQDDAAGDDFIVWEGDNYYSQPGVGLLTYEIEITTPGLYQFQWHSQIGQGNNHTEHNDSWLRIDSDLFYGYEETTDTYVHPPSPQSIVAGTYPDGATAAHGGWNNGGWFKVFSSRNDWTWSTKTNDGSFHDIFAQFDAAGTYTIEISARSSHHVLDRLVLHHVDYEGDPYDLTLPESPKAGEVTPPPLEPPVNEPPVEEPPVEEPPVEEPPVEEPPVNEEPRLPDEVSIYLIDTVSDLRVAEITNGGTVPVDAVPSGRYSIEVAVPDYAETVVSAVSLSLNGAAGRTEKAAPYALFGDNGGDFFGLGSLSTGDMDLAIEVFDASGASVSFDVAFEVTPDEAPAGALELGTTEIRQTSPDDWVRVDFENEIPDAVVVMGPLSNNGSAPATVRVRDVDETGFEFQVDEWGYLDGTHARETVSWMAATSGVHTLADGTTIAAGSVTARDNTRESIDFGTTFNEDPAFFAQVASDNGPQAVTIRTDDVTGNGADVFMQEEEASDQRHTQERVDWIAIEPGNSDAWQIQTFELSDSPFEFTYDEADPVILAGMQTANGMDTANLRIDDHGADGTSIWVSEERSADTETTHIAEEVKTLVAAADTFDLFA